MYKCSINQCADTTDVILICSLFYFNSVVEHDSVVRSVFDSILPRRTVFSLGGCPRNLCWRCSCRCTGTLFSCFFSSSPARPSYFWFRICFIDESREKTS